MSKLGIRLQVHGDDWTNDISRAGNLFRRWSELSHHYQKMREDEYLSILNNMRQLESLEFAYGWTALRELGEVSCTGKGFER